MAKKANRLIITLACSECKERNYTTEKNRQNDAGRLELKKVLSSVSGPYASPRNEVSAVIDQAYR